MAVEIRPARATDLADLARLVAAIAAWHEQVDERVRFDWDNIRDAPNWMRLVLSRDHHAVWVADHGGGRLVGYLWVHLHRQRQGYLPEITGYISHAFLEENWRGKGLMGSMLELAYDWFREKGVKVITLGVLHRNWIGRQAWDRLGFLPWNEERRLVLRPRAGSPSRRPT